MSWVGWLFMTFAWGSILTLFGYCMVRTLRGNGNGKGNPDSSAEIQSGQDVRE